jgi:hypothetical protein
MKRLVLSVLALGFLAGSSAGCSDDRVTFSRGPLGPASYEVEVRAAGEGSGLDEEHRATLRIEPRGSDAARFTLRSAGGEDITADLSFLDGGRVDLTRVRGAPVQGSGQTELASLVGQLNPPLPTRPVRLGDSWSSTQRITTRALSASLRTELRMVRFRRIAEMDAAELAGDVTGRLRVTDGARVLDGELTGKTEILWAVRSGRVAAADTELVWGLSDGSRVTLETTVEPR